MSRLLLLLLLVAGPACTHYVPVIASPAAKQAYAADQVVTRIEELQTVVIDLALSNQIPMPTARIIVKWTVAANTTIGQTPNGWQAVVSVGWRQIRDEVAKLPQLAQWVPIIDALIGGV